MRWRSRIRSAFLLIGAGLLAVVGIVLLDAAVTQARLTDRLAEFEGLIPRDGLERATSTRREALENGLIGRIELPRVGLEAIVVEGVGARALSHGVGHIPSTAYPGERGNTGLAGHRDSYFRELEHVQEGDLIELETPDGRFSYRIRSIQIVEPDRADLLAPTDETTLTLVTCYPFRWIGPAPRRLVVQAVAE